MDGRGWSTLLSSDNLDDWRLRVGQQLLGPHELRPGDVAPGQRFHHCIRGAMSLEGEVLIDRGEPASGFGRGVIHIDRKAGRDADRVGAEVAVGLSQSPGKAVGCGTCSPFGLAHRVVGSANGRVGKQQGQSREGREGGQCRF